MLMGAADEVVGDTGINGAPFAAGDDVDEVRPLHVWSEAWDRVESHVLPYAAISGWVPAFPRASSRP
jgi:hypothetical protein